MPVQPLSHLPESVLECITRLPRELTSDFARIRDPRAGVPLREVYGYEPSWGQVSAEQRDAIVRLMAGAPVGGSAPAS